jgi:hypothetical protein
MKSVKLFLGLVLSVVAVSCGTPAPEQEVKADSVAVVDTTVVVADSVVAVEAVAAEVSH